MLTFDSIPQARLVRHGNRHFAPPPAPRVREPSVIREQLHAVFAVALGLWPLTAVLLLSLGLLVMAGNGGAP